MSTALYRRYRPETFADVIGQEHVTEPLMAALGSDRINHAYLFSGPRGCGKTTSARILARCLNCAEGPTPTPCGRCDSCTELARGGPGSLDVVEMDAASHGGVDDARELRERAAFAPARDRFKVFIIDEAHMVTPQGFNALLKLVEEPPPHVIFVFATTEPEKVIGTIRSRTHHYPFRLVPPDRLTAYLESLATAEHVQIDSGVLPLVVRAGGGSVRDSLSVLDQLIAGAADGVVGYERAVALLGFTHGTLLDDTVEALAARDGGSLFRVIDRVIGTGHAPRRFVEDLLERLRDLIVVRAAGEHAASVLRAVPQDQLQRMQAQAGHLGAATLSRSADLVNEALTEMTGATSPQLQLELLCARLLLPAADDGTEGFGARLDRVEGALAGGVAAAPASPPASPPASATPPARAPAEEQPRPPVPTASSTPPPANGDDSSPQTPTDEPPADAPVAAIPAPEQPATLAPAPVSEEKTPLTTPGGQDEEQAARTVTAPAEESTAAGMTADGVRRRWPEVLETLARLKRISWALISQDAQVVDLTSSTLTLGFSTSGLASTFRNGPHADFVARSLQETLGLEVRIDAVVTDSAAPAAGGGASTPPAPTSSDWGTPAAEQAPTGQGPTGQAPTGPPAERQPRAGVTPPAGASRADDAPPWDVPEQSGREPRAGHGSSSESDDAADAEADPGPAPADGWPDLPPAPPSWDEEPPPPEEEPPSQYAGPRPTPEAAGTSSPAPSPVDAGASPRDQAFAAARQAATTGAHPPGADALAGAHSPPSELEEDSPSPDDPDIESTGLVGAPLVARLLGGTVIDEIVEHPDGSEQ
ncbi:DNA polymerase III subunit gamma and tau [Ruania suaedae]|uniref:DNA polymerase III subunit gamma and tau n=1 Tax=Ruania suaedae TaxID=2897774 RepID=UPI001E51C1B5|nr:DNA polymerase III subunit gamma and tau [Ruania suaedae]UFU03374.1 DNA polymerase III subunit gamma and tau [Ruania suaedae]